MGTFCENPFINGKDIHWYIKSDFQDWHIWIRPNWVNKEAVFVKKLVFWRWTPREKNKINTMLLKHIFNYVDNPVTENSIARKQLRQNVFLIFVYYSWDDFQAISYSLWIWSRMVRLQMTGVFFCHDTIKLTWH